MDKFGIFNILSSLMGNSSGEMPDTSTETPLKNAPLNFLKTPLSSLFSSFLSGNLGKPPADGNVSAADKPLSENNAVLLPKENATGQRPTNSYPLSAKMLSVMKNHDEIVSRVKSNKKKL